MLFKVTLLKKIFQVTSCTVENTTYIWPKCVMKNAIYSEKTTQTVSRHMWHVCHSSTF